MLVEIDYNEAANIWFTGDHHFGHENIIKYCDRPFKDVTQMDETLIFAWNARVGPEDIVFYLGDLTLKDKASAEYYFSNLNGRIHVLTNEWHHDKRWLGDDNEHYTYRSKSQYRVEFLPGLVVLELQNYNNGKFPLTITLCHYPMAEWDSKHYGAWHLHGHTHGRYHSEDGYILDVGVDEQDYHPVNLRDIELAFSLKN